MARRETSQTQTAPSGRPKRTSLAVRNRLFVRNKEEGYVYRIVNDIDDNIQNRVDQGYEIVPADKVGRVGDARVDNASAPGSSSYLSVGGGVKAVVMRIKKEWYDEDQAAKQQQVDEIEQTMRQKDSDYGNLEIQR